MLTWWTRVAGVFYTRPSREVMCTLIWPEGIIKCTTLTIKLISLKNPIEDLFYLPKYVSFSVFLGDEFASTFLIRHSAQVNAATVGAVETPLHLVCSFSPKKHSGEVMAGMARIAEALLKAGANPNMQNSKGRWVK